MRLLRALLPLALVAALAGCGGTAASDSARSVTAAQPAAQTTQQARTTAGTQAKAPNGDIYDWIPHLYDRVSPKIVAILVSGTQGQGEGSGVIWSKDGYIVTDEHVVANASQIMVAFSSGERVPAKVVATDTETDLAVIKVQKTGLPVAQFAKSLPKVGQLALAIGSPLGFQSSLTQGIISGLHRNLPAQASSRPLVDLIQTDAPISPGNSGGALINEYGVVVGINEAYIPPSQGAVALGFATPAPTVRYVVQQLIASGKVEHAFLGIQPADITSAIAQQFNLKTSSGALVYDVVSGSASAKAGVKPGDVIVQLGGKKIQDVSSLLATLREHRPGDKVQVTVIRNGDRKQLTVTLAARSSG